MTWALQLLTTYEQVIYWSLAWAVHHHRESAFIDKDIFLFRRVPWQMTKQKKRWHRVLCCLK